MVSSLISGKYLPHITHPVWYGRWAARRKRTLWLVDLWYAGYVHIGCHFVHVVVDFCTKKLHLIKERGWNWRFNHWVELAAPCNWMVPNCLIGIGRGWNDLPPSWSARRGSVKVLMVTGKESASRLKSSRPWVNSFVMTLPSSICKLWGEPRVFVKQANTCSSSCPTSLSSRFCTDVTESTSISYPEDAYDKQTSDLGCSSMSKWRGMFSLKRLSVSLHFWFVSSRDVWFLESLWVMVNGVMRSFWPKVWPYFCGRSKREVFLTIP